MTTINFTLEDLEVLEEKDLIQVEGGGFLDRNWGGDIGYALGWLLSAAGKGASAIHG